MSLRIAVAAPFRGEAKRVIEESSFVVALSLDRDWFSPDQSKRLVDVAVGEGLLDRTDDGLRVQFDPDDVTVPEEFHPDEEILRQRSTFERVLDACLDADIEKRDAVAAINRLQAELAVTIEAAAVVYAHRHGVDVQQHAAGALEEL